jgi:hypothetical protein
MPRGGGFRLHPITIVVGEPIRFTKADFEGGGRDRYREISQRVLDAIGTLELPESAR